MYIHIRQSHWQVQFLHYETLEIQKKILIRSNEINFLVINLVNILYPTFGVALFHSTVKKNDIIIIYFMVKFVDFIAVNYNNSLDRLCNLILYSLF